MKQPESHSAVQLSVMTQLFVALAKPPSTILPNLASLIIHLNSSNFSDSFCTTLLRSLSARRTQLRIVRINLLPQSVWQLPSAGNLAAFREFAVDRVQVHIGPEKHNLV
jgi:hypothetical protein